MGIATTGATSEERGVVDVRVVERQCRKERISMQI